MHIYISLSIYVYIHACIYLSVSVYIYIYILYHIVSMHMNTYSSPLGSPAFSVTLSGLAPAGGASRSGDRGQVGENPRLAAGPRRSVELDR